MESVTVPRVNKMRPEKLLSWKQTGNRLHFRMSNAELEVTIISDFVFRFRYTAEERFDEDFSYAVPELNDCLANTFHITEKSDAVIILTEELLCNISKTDLSISIADKRSKIILEDISGFHWDAAGTHGNKRIYSSKKIQEEEYFFGLGDKATDLNLRNRHLDIWASDVYGFKKDQDPLYKNIPFYLGFHHEIGYGIFFDNSFHSFFDFGKEESSTCTFGANGGNLNYYFIYGPELINVVEKYADLTGKPEMPPLWTLGYQQCKWSYKPDTQVLEIANQFRTRKIPCDVIYLDIDYMDGYRCFTWDEKQFPDPAKMIKDLDAMGFKVVVIIDPGIKVDKDYWVYREGVKNNYFCRRADGTLMKGKVWPGECHFPDFTNPDVRKWWAGLFEELIESGVKGIWNDMNEPVVFEINTFPDDVRHYYDTYRCSHLKAHNVYGMQMARATQEGIRKYLAPHRPFVITRSGYSGVQRYSSVWTGDNLATWEHLWLANLMIQRLNVSGISFAGTDIGGFLETPDGELFVRWIQLATFHPFMRTHSAGDKNTMGQEPWVFGHKYEFIVKRFLKLRYQLLPYLYTAFWQNSTKGTPMIRPIAFLDQHDPQTWFRQEEFQVGDSILVCPVSKQGVDGRRLYLPKGNWFDFWTDDLVKGGHEMYVLCPLEKCPIYIKAGAVVPHFPAMQYVGEQPVHELALHVYYKEGELTSFLYEDARDGYAYRDGQQNVKEFHVDGKKNLLVLQQHITGNFDPEYLYYNVVVHGLPFKCETLMVDGKVVRLSKKNFAVGTIKIKVDKHFRQIIFRATRIT